MSNANNRGWTCASCLTQRTTEWVETDKLRADLDEAMRQRAHWMEEARRYCKNNEDACAEVERLRAEANARAVEELHRVQQWVMENRVPAFGSTHMAVTCAQVKSMVADRIAELSKPAAKESEPARCAERVWASGDMEACGKPLPCSDHTKPEEEPDWTVTLAAQAKAVYDEDTPDESVSAALLLEVVRGLCNLGREVRRGGKS